MTTVSINSKNNTARYVRESLAGVYNSLSKLSTGMKYSNPGEGTVEQAMARSIDARISVNEITKNIANDATNLLDSTYQTIANIKDDVMKQYKLAVTASTSGVADLEDLDKQFSTIKTQIDSSAKAEFNGKALLSGGFSGKSVIETKIGTKEEYVVDNVKQYAATGKINTNSLLKTDEGSIAISGVLGRSQATAVLAIPNAIVAGDQFVFNGVTLTARNASAIVDPTVEFAFDVNPNTTVKNLINLLKTSTKPELMEASYRYVENTGLSLNKPGIKIYANNLGAKGNDFAFSSTGANVTASTKLSGGADYMSVGDNTFDVDLRGKFEDFQIKFKFDSVKMANVIKFEARINGNIYSTQEMVLGMEGLGGFNGQGNKIAANTMLYFQKLNAADSDIGFTMQVNNKGLLLSAINESDVQDEVSNVAKEVLNALSDFEFKLNAAPKVIDDFGLRSNNDFVNSGSVKEGAYFTNNVKFSSKVAKETATGIIRIVSQPKSSEVITINGKDVVFGFDVKIGNTTAETRDNLIKYLNESTDINISKAFYYASPELTESSIIVKHKAAGVEGNNFTISVKTDNYSLNNLLPNVKTVHLGDNSVQSTSAKKLQASKATGSIKLVNNPATNSAFVIGGTPVSTTGVMGGTVVLFKTTTATVTDTTMTQVALGTSTAITTANLLAALNASTDPILSKATYVLDAVDNTKINITYKEDGLDGNTLFNIIGRTGTATVAPTVTGDYSPTRLVSFGTTTAMAATVAAVTQLSGATMLEIAPTGNKAQGSILFGVGGPAANDTVTINGTVFTFKAAVAAATDVLVGANANQSAYNLYSTILKNVPTTPTLATVDYEFIDVLKATDKNNMPGIKITAQTPGDAGNNFTLATSVAYGANVKIIVQGASTTANTTKLTGGYDGFNNYVVSGTDDIHAVANNFSGKLKGKINAFSADFISGEFISDIVRMNSVEFKTKIGDIEYTGSAVLSGGNVKTGVGGTGTNFNGLGSILSKGSEITLYSKEKTPGIVLTLSESIDLAASNISAARQKLQEVVTKMNDDLAEIEILQERRIVNFEESKVQDTVLKGLKKENVKIVDSHFTDAGTGGSVEGFKVDNANGIISVNIGGVAYSLKLANTVALGGLGENYDAFNKLIKGGAGSTLVFSPADAKDKRALKINLAGVADINISDAKQALAFETALNAGFGAGSSSGIQFKVGKSENSAFVMNFGNLTTEGLYKDAQGVALSNLSLADSASAKLAAEVLERSLKSVSGELSSIGVSRNRLMSIAQSLQAEGATLQNSYDEIMNADVAEVSSEMVGNMLKVSTSAIAQLHESNILRELVSTLSSAGR